MGATRRTRAMVGASCLVAVALAMGWFVGHFVPGEPKAPESDLRYVLADDTGRTASSTVEFAAGTAMKLPELLQGEAYERGDALNATVPDAAIKYLKEQGAWEAVRPSLDVSVVESRVIAMRSLTDWNPSAYSSFALVIDDTKEVLVTIALTNTSDKPYQAWWSTIPTMTLWSDNLVNGDDTLGAGIRLDTSAVFLVNPRTWDAATQQYAPLVDIDPGETQELTLGFTVPRTALVDQTAFGDLKPSDFCLQTADYATGTSYRLWL